MAQVPHSISAFFIGGNVPKEKVGDMLEFLYLNSADGFKLEPLFDKPPPKQRHLSNGAAPKQLAPPAAADAAPPVSIRQGLKTFLLTLLKDGPLEHEAIHQRAKLAGFGRPHTATRLWELRRDKLIKRTGNMYRLLTNGHAAAPTPAAAPKASAGPRSRPGSQLTLVLDAIRRAYPGTVTRADLCKMLAAHGERERSYSVATHTLKAKRLITYVSPGVYQLVPPKS